MLRENTRCMVADLLGLKNVPKNPARRALTTLCTCSLWSDYQGAASRPQWATSDRYSGWAQICVPRALRPRISGTKIRSGNSRWSHRSWYSNSRIAVYVRGQTCLGPMLIATCPSSCTSHGTTLIKGSTSKAPSSTDALQAFA